jgi:hypothetical protein
MDRSGENHTAVFQQLDEQFGYNEGMIDKRDSTAASLRRAGASGGVMKHWVKGLLVITVIVALVGVSAPADAAKKVKERTSSATGTFVNQSGEVAHGLAVKLSSSAIVLVDEKGHAGPFRDISGNDTSHLVMLNPSEPIAGEEKLELTFASYEKSLKITTWWWVDAKGKRIGKKQKP